MSFGQGSVFKIRFQGSVFKIHFQESVFKIRFQGSVVKTDHCSYLVMYSPDVLRKKTKVLDIFNTEKKYLN